MKFAKTITAAFLTCVLSAAAAQAQIKEQQPAEFPPSSYKGKQYVDSTGCVFIRAGIDGDVSWVPRVTRSRKTVCGFKPSLGTRTAEAEPVPTPPVDRPVQITLNNATTTPAPVAAPAPRAVVKKRRAPVVVRQTAPKPKPRVVRQPAVIVAAPAPAIRQAAQQQVTTACPGASAISQKYLQGNGRNAVRCGPQTEAIVGNTGRYAAAAPQQRVASTTRRRSAAVAPVAVAPTTRIVPKHVAVKRINTQNVTMPPGYKKVWNDGRLNPKRAEQNLAGRQQMLLIWTQTVPRRLINQTTGRDVTASVPLVYPYLDVAQQQRELGEVTIVRRNGQVVKRVVRHRSAAKTVQRKPVYSSRSAPAKKQPVAKAPSRAAVAGKRYVQIGTFKNSGNAQRAAQKVARMGMPARIGKHRKGGKTYMTVQAGPFNGTNAMKKAMSRLRGAGYRDAFARN